MGVVIKEIQKVSINCVCDWQTEESNRRQADADNTLTAC